jgi:hypothetical protein
MSTTVPDIGIAINYIIITCSAIVIGNGVIIMNKYIGISNGLTISIGDGSSIVDDTTFFMTDDVINSMAVIMDLYTEIRARTATYTLTQTDFGGHVFTAGIYSITNFYVFSNNTITFDGENDPDAFWIINCDYINIYNIVSIILDNGANVKNIFWTSSSSINIGYGCTIRGIFLSSGNIVVGYSGITEGCYYCTCNNTLVKIGSGSVLYNNL